MLLTKLEEARLGINMPRDFVRSAKPTDSTPRRRVWPIHPIRAFIVKLSSFIFRFQPCTFTICLIYHTHIKHELLFSDLLYLLF